MQPNFAPTTRIALLVLLAAVLSIVLVLVDQHRRAADAIQLPATVAAVPAAAVTGALGAGGTVASAAVEPELVSLATPPQPVAVRGCAKEQTIARVTRDLPIRSGPGSGAVIGTIPASSKYLGQPMSAWVRNVSDDGRFGQVTVPWRSSPRSGWVDISALAQTSTIISVRADLSARQLEVWRGCRVILRAPMTIGSSQSPSPAGRFWVTDPIAVPSSQPQFGSYAFGLSAVQPNPPPGWTGGNQMAIHGTNNPSSIGKAASAGCLRVSEATLARLQTLLVRGTPVTIVS